MDRNYIYDQSDRHPVYGSLQLLLRSAEYAAVELTDRACNETKIDFN